MSVKQQEKFNRSVYPQREQLLHLLKFNHWKAVLPSIFFEKKVNS